MPIRISHSDGAARLHWDIRLAYSAHWLVVLAVIGLPYLLWEVYWIWHSGYAAIRWHTHLALYFYLWLAISTLLAATLRRPASAQLLVAAVCGTLMTAEAILLLTGVQAVYTERMGYGYSSIYSTRGETYYRTRTPGTTVWFDRPEFRHSRSVNAMGYSDHEWPLQKQPGEKRILCLGDSWTEGIGAPYDSTYVSFLVRILAASYPQVTVMNAGTAADDPCVNYVNYRDRLVAYHPDVIIQTLSCNDITTDIATKGGMERFGPPGQLHVAPAPVWEPVYAVSIISRLVVHALGYNYLLQKVPFSPAKTKELDQKVIALFREYAALAHQQGTELIIVIQCNEHDFDLAPIITALQQLPGVRVYDQQAFYTAEFATPGHETRSYYWPVDGHHNPRGYELMARSVYQALDSFYLRPIVQAQD